MDIHRCRFVEYTPSAINALAFSHSSGKASRDQPLRLAVGRANGNIEIWDPKKGAWIHELTLYGGRGRSVDGLAWVHDPDEIDGAGFVRRGKLRLFSIGYSSTVTEWDLITGLPLRNSGGQHSEVWCLAAQPASSNPPVLPRTDTNTAGYRGQDLVAGCADGSLVLLSTADDSLTFKKIISSAGKKKARALSISFQSRNVVVVGFADSSIRVYDIRSGNILRSISVGGGMRGGPKETLIWAVECLKDGTIVAGDSSGEVSFWDGTTYGQLQRLKTHEADILCLASSADGQTVLSSGIDRRTCVYNLVDTIGSKRRWSKVAHKRFHRHDVKAMARFENSKMSIVVSGGLDTAPVLIPLRNFETEYHRQLPFVPQCSPVTGAQRLLATWRHNEVAVWHVGSREALEGLLGQHEANYKLMASITLKGEENITSASLSASGRILAVSTVAQTSLFHLQPITKDADAAISVCKIKMPAILNHSGGRFTHFSPDSRWLLVVRCDGNAQLCRIVEHPDSSPSVVSTAIVLARTEHSNEKKLQNCLNGHWGCYDRTILRAVFSSDGRICAASDLAGRIHTWVLEGYEDLTAPPVDYASDSRPMITSTAESEPESDNDPDKDKNAIIYGQHWIRNPYGAMLPHLPSPPLILSFRPDSIFSGFGTDPSHHLVQKVPNGNPAVHPTRRNPHAHSHTVPSYPSCEDRLLVLTADHELLEFHAISGKLTDWSRSNPPSLLPDQFKLQRDRAIGAVWDIVRERVWIHSATWLAMFDLRFDLQGPLLGPSAELTITSKRGNSILSANGRGPNLVSKRRRSSAIALEIAATSAQKTRAQMDTRQNTSGIAGSAIRQEDLGGSASARKIRKLTANGQAEVVLDRQKATMKSGTDGGERDNGIFEEDDEDSTSSLDVGIPALQMTRRERGSMNKHSNDEPVRVILSDEGDSEDEGPLPFYLTTRYRQIVGIVALQPDKHETGPDDLHRPLEVALLERPFAALDLGPRYIGAQEWER